MPSDENNGRRGTARREDSFLARWSRRKHEAEQVPRSEETEPVEAPVDTEAQASDTDTGTGIGTTEEEAGTTVQEVEATEPDLPHPDTLDQNSDFSAYLTKRVSSAFRRAAMRRLFSAPEFNVRDGLDDYDEDYTKFQSLGNTVTAHMRHHAERLRQREQDKAEKAERDAEIERERTAEREEPEQTTERNADATPATEEQQAATADDPTPADDTPDPKTTARTATNQDTDDTT